MAVVAVAAVAAATWFAAAAQGLDALLAVLGAALACTVAAASRRSARGLPPGKDVVVLTAVTFGGLFVLFMAGWTDQAHHDDVARLLPWAVVALSGLWPEPNVVRYCLLLAGGALLGAAVTGDDGPVRWAVGGALVAMAVALVATNRLAAAGAPPLGGSRPTGRKRVAGEAVAVLAVVGLLAALAASLVPPPPGRGGAGFGGRSGEHTLRRPAAPSLDFGDRLDAGAGRGRRGNEVVLTIDAPAPDVWRAVTYDHWDGRSWARSPQVLTEVGAVVLPGLGDVETGQARLEFGQRVTVQARAASVVVAAPRPVLLDAEPVVRQAPDGSLHPERPLLRGETYVVYSARSFPGRDALRAAAGRVPDDVAGAYLQLPAVPPGVRALAAEIAAGAPTGYDRALALEGWLRDNTTVTAEATPVPPGADALESFLLDDRSGPAERAATAMAVMLRAVGVPARIAAGFLPGRRDGPDGEFVVRLRDTHAWVEAWFPGFGWQRFDPTGEAPPTETDTQSAWDRLGRFLRGLWPLAAALALVAGGWLAWRAARWWQRRAALPWAARFLARLEREGTARGRPRQPQETPAEYAGHLSRTVLPDPALDEVGELVTVAAYSRREPPLEQRARAEAVLREAATASPVRRGFMAALRRRSGVHRSPAPPRPTIRKP